MLLRIGRDDVREQSLFCIQNDEFCIENDELCIENDEFCIENDEFCIKRPAVHAASRYSYDLLDFIKQNDGFYKNDGFIKTITVQFTAAPCFPEAFLRKCFGK